MRVVFSDPWFAEDLARSSAGARQVARRARRQLERHGITAGKLRRCDDHDGAALPGCLKAYVGPATGRGPGEWGMVFAPQRDQHGAFLVCLAFGLRHPDSVGSRQPSVYQVAHRRLRSAT